MDNKVKQETIETMVKQAQANLQKTMAEILTERTRGQVNAATINDITSQINTRAEQMAQQWRRIKIEGGNYQLNRDKFEVEANTENLIQATNNEKIRRGLILANIRYQDAMEELTRNQADAKKLEFGQITQGIKNLEKAWEQLDANVEGIKMDNKVKQDLS